MVGPLRFFRVLFATLVALVCFLHAQRSVAGIIVHATVHSDIYFSTDTTTPVTTFDATYSATNQVFSSSHEYRNVNNLLADSYVDNAYFTEDLFDPITYLNFYQSAQLQIVSGTVFSPSDFLSLEIITLLSFELSSPVLLVGGSLSNSPIQNTGFTFTNSSSGLSAEWSSDSIFPTPSLVDALNSVSGGNNSPYLFNQGLHSVRLKSKVKAENFDIGTLAGLVAESRFNVNLAFAAAPVPEPTSCFVAGLLFGSIMVGKSLRRRKSV